MSTMRRWTGDPWDRQPDESAKAYAAFCAFRDMGALKRSVLGLARQLERGHDWLQEWSTRWDWRKRAEAWDAHLEEEGRLAQIDAVRDMNDRQARAGMLILRKIAQRLEGDDVENIKALDINKLTASDIAKLAEVGARMERMARGEETERLGINSEEKTEHTIKVAFEVAPHFPSSDDDGAQIIDGSAIEEMLP